MQKVLFITYFWPPSGKATLHWPLKIIKHLPVYGWQPMVLTVDEDTFSQKDESLLKDVDPRLKVFTAHTLEPFSLYRRLLGKEKNAPLTASETISTTNHSLRHRLSVWIRMNLFIPDARIGWYWNAVRRGKEILQSEPVKAIVSIGPPHTTLLVGNTLSRISGIPHIPVFIDPWVDISYYRGFKRSKATLAIDRRFERSVVDHAAHVVFVTETMKQDYIRQYPSIQKKSHVLYWGYDEEAFQSFQSHHAPDQEIILHAGNIYDHQNPVNLWKTLRQEAGKGRNIKIVFVGTVSPGIRKSLADEGLIERTEFKGFLPYREMIEEMSRASYLLVCASEKRHVPGKLFEYLRTGKPILAFGDDNIEVQRILEESHAGMIFPLNGTGGEFFQRCRQFKTDPNSVYRFDRKEISGSLANILDTIAPPAETRR
ncbi:MAG: glycosyltransferase [Ignavibacteriae bacterium]|nr:MAG: glycosyltransferase [Ignavibacteriota bacterium]